MTSDIAIIGGGIMGLAHAWSARQRGHQVTVYERSPQAEQASVRNFGMIWPVGQVLTDMQSAALLSRERWRSAAAEAGCWLNECGSLHLAHHDDEMAVLEEFVAAVSDMESPPGAPSQFRVLSREETLQRTSAANPQGLRGALWSPLEMGVNPRDACRMLSRWLAGQGVAFRYETAVSDVTVDEEGPRGVRLREASGGAFAFDRAIICAGADFRSLLPQAYTDAGLRPCKLHMLRTPPQARGWRIGPHLASGLTLRHYHNFEPCPTLDNVRRRIAEQSPELDQYGIHVMASQDDQQQIILGDSHEYGSDVAPFDKSEIDALILRELQKVFAFPNWTIAERWHGVYAKYDEPLYRREPLPNVHVFTGVGGAGMTLSFGIAEQAWQDWDAAGEGVEGG